MMQTMVLRALSALLLSTTLIGCASAMKEPGQIRPVLLYPPVPYEKLACPLEPPPPDKGASQEVAAIWAERVRKAGEDCRANLDFLRAYLLTWESKIDMSDVWVDEGDDY